MFLIFDFTSCSEVSTESSIFEICPQGEIFEMGYWLRILFFMRHMIQSIWNLQTKLEKFLNRDTQIVTVSVSFFQINWVCKRERLPLHSFTWRYCIKPVGINWTIARHGRRASACLQQKYTLIHMVDYRNFKFMMQFHLKFRKISMEKAIILSNWIH